MARALGYGVGNTNGARTFTGKEESEVIPALVSTFAVAIQIGISIALVLLF